METPPPSTPPPPCRGRWRKVLSFAANVAGAALVGGMGWMLAEASRVVGQTEREKPRFGWLLSSLAESLGRLSYDLPFVVRGPVEAPEVCIVDLDQNSAEALGQTWGVWDRELHTQLVRRLTADGARLIFFDLLFIDPWPQPEVDEDFAAAMRASGRVVIGSKLERSAEAGGALRLKQQRTINPTPVLRKAAATKGLLSFWPEDDYAVRRLHNGLDLSPTATWNAAMLLRVPLADTREVRAQWRWLNYYGPANSFPDVSLKSVLAEDALAPGFFRDRLVFIGGRSELTDRQRFDRDTFVNPFSRLGGDLLNGVELHATVLLNLLRGDWLVRLEPAREVWLILAYGVLLGGLLPLLRPHLATLAALGCALVAGGGAYLLFTHTQTWLAWGIPVLVQTPLALGWGLGTRYFLEERRRNALRRAFGLYLSPKMADRIADAQVDLTPGGVLLEVSVMFTDLEGFTAMSERMNDPARLSRVLIDYFTHTTGHVLENDGTIVKYIGDAVMAVWGAPLPDAQHPRKAALAAWRLHRASGLEVDGRALRTRIGLHTGQGLAGNLGSAQRFDYTVIGDTTNFASRLEGMNKYLGTSILISEATRARLGGEFLVRPLGKFRVVGKSAALRIHELLGPAAEAEPAPWLAPFEQGLAAFTAGDLAAAARQMEEVCTQHPDDGPAKFYLETIARLRTTGLPEKWDGVVEFASK